MPSSLSWQLLTSSRWGTCGRRSTVPPPAGAIGTESLRLLLGLGLGTAEPLGRWVLHVRGLAGCEDIKTLSFARNSCPFLLQHSKNVFCAPRPSPPILLRIPILQHQKICPIFLRPSSQRVPFSSLWRDREFATRHRHH